MAEPRPICSKCSLEMRVFNTGAQVVTLFTDKQIPYEIWTGDEFKCPWCGFMVVVNFGDGGHPHHAPGFDEEIAFLKEQDAIPVYFVPEKYIRETELRDIMFTPQYKSPHFKGVFEQPGYFVTTLRMDFVPTDESHNLTKEIVQDLCRLAEEEHGGSFSYSSSMLDFGPHFAMHNTVILKREG